MSQQEFPHSNDKELHLNDMTFDIETMLFQNKSFGLSGTKRV